jgi:hypothetical protein
MDDGAPVAGGGGAKGSETAATRDVAAGAAGVDVAGGGGGVKDCGGVLVGPGNPGSGALSVPPIGEGAAAVAAVAAGASVSGGGKGCGGGLVEPEKGGVTAWADIPSGTDGVPVAASIPSGICGDVEGDLADGDGDGEGGGGGVEAVGEGAGAVEASGAPENGGVTAFNCDASVEGDFASVTICSGGWSGAAGSPWKAIASSEYLLRARSATNPSVSSLRCSGVLVAGRSGTLARAGKGSVAPGVRPVDAD